MTNVSITAAGSNEPVNPPQPSQNPQQNQQPGQQNQQGGGQSNKDKPAQQK
jgi:hypothetical protein